MSTKGRRVSNAVNGWGAKAVEEKIPFTGDDRKGEKGGLFISVASHKVHVDAGRAALKGSPTFVWRENKEKRVFTMVNNRWVLF